MTNSQHTEAVKHVIDALSATVVIGAIMEWLPPIAALLTIIWTLIRIWESETVQRFIDRWRQ